MQQYVRLHLLLFDGHVVFGVSAAVGGVVRPAKGCRMLVRNSASSDSRLRCLVSGTIHHTIGNNTTLAMA
jgi:hypothetical protein